MDSPEYNTVIQCFPKLFSSIQRSPVDVAAQLEPCGILAPRDWSYVKNPNNNNDDKAMMIVDAVRSQIKLDSQVFDKFVSALEAAGHWTRVVVCELQRTHTSLMEGPPKKRFRSSEAENIIGDSESEFIIYPFFYGTYLGIQIVDQLAGSILFLCKLLFFLRSPNITTYTMSSRTWKSWFHAESDGEYAILYILNCEFGSLVLRVLKVLITTIVVI